MELRRELSIVLAVMVALNLALAFGAIGLFSRMGPAIERILIENLYSIDAAEEMLSVLAEHTEHGASDELRQRFDDAVLQAKGNLTEDREADVLARLEAGKDAALSGDEVARLAAIADVRILIDLNRAAMHEVDLEAQRLSTAGAWTAAFIAVLSFVLSLFVARRVATRILGPLEDLQRVLEAARAGERFRRCRASEGPAELRRVAQSVNALLDERMHPDA
jgi:methyl-accepting chemotaxis protein